MPELRKVFRDACPHYTEAVAAFDPAKHKLLDEHGKLTELALYCCYEDKLAEVLISTKWSNTNELLQTKLALRQTLPEDYQRKYEAVLDTAALRRTGRFGDAPLLRRLRPESGTGFTP